MSVYPESKIKHGAPEGLIFPHNSNQPLYKTKARNEIDEETCSVLAMLLLFSLIHAQKNKEATREKAKAVSAKLREMKRDGAVDKRGICLQFI